MRKLVKQEKLCLFIETMPRTQSDDHGAGYIRGRMDQLRELLNRLADEEHIFARQEVIKMMEEVHRTQLAIQSNVYATRNEQARQILTEYVAMARSIHDRAADLLSGLGGAAGLNLPPRPDIENIKLLKKKKPRKNKRKNKDHIDWSKFTFGDESDGPEDENASDNEQPMSLNAMSAVYAGQNTRAANPEDLRHHINRSQQIRADNEGQRRRDDNNDEDDWNRPGPSNARPRAPPVRNEWNQAGPSGMQQRPEQIRSTVSVVSGYTNSTYVSQPQEHTFHRLTGVLYPPMAYESPVPISKKDETLIGKAEYFTTLKEYHGKCPLCKGKHKVYRCTQFLRAGLQERWYLALKYGLCLNCLFPKHSSFTCRQMGACIRCGQRHNSLLCPRHPEWRRDGDRDKA